MNIKHPQLYNTKPTPQQINYSSNNKYINAIINKKQQNKLIHKKEQNQSINKREQYLIHKKDQNNFINNKKDQNNFITNKKEQNKSIINKKSQRQLSLSKLSNLSSLSSNLSKSKYKENIKQIDLNEMANNQQRKKSRQNNKINNRNHQLSYSYEEEEYPSQNQQNQQKHQQHQQHHYEHQQLHQGKQDQYSQHWHKQHENHNKQHSPSQLSRSNNSSTPSSVQLQIHLTISQRKYILTLQQSTMRNMKYDLSPIVQSFLIQNNISNPSKKNYLKTKQLIISMVEKKIEERKKQNDQQQMRISHQKKINQEILKVKEIKNKKEMVNSLNVMKTMLYSTNEQQSNQREVYQNGKQTNNSNNNNVSNSIKHEKSQPIITVTARQNTFIGCNSNRNNKAKKQKQLPYDPSYSQLSHNDLQQYHQNTQYHEQLFDPHENKSQYQNQYQQQYQKQYQKQSQNEQYQQQCYSPNFKSTSISKNEMKHQPITNKFQISHCEGIKCQSVKINQKLNEMNHKNQQKQTQNKNSQILLKKRPEYIQEQKQKLNLNISRTVEHKYEYQQIIPNKKPQPVAYNNNVIQKKHQQQQQTQQQSLNVSHKPVYQVGAKSVYQKWKMKQKQKDNHSNHISMRETNYNINNFSSTQNHNKSDPSLREIKPSNNVNTNMNSTQKINSSNKESNVIIKTIDLKQKQQGWTNVNSKKNNNIGRTNNNNNSRNNIENIPKSPIKKHQDLDSSSLNKSQFKNNNIRTPVKSPLKTVANIKNQEKSAQKLKEIKELSAKKIADSYSSRKLNQKPQENRQNEEQPSSQSIIHDISPDHFYKQGLLFQAKKQQQNQKKFKQFYPFTTKKITDSENKDTSKSKYSSQLNRNPSTSSYQSSRSTLPLHERLYKQHTTNNKQMLRLQTQIHNSASNFSPLNNSETMYKNLSMIKGLNNNVKQKLICKNVMLKQKLREKDCLIDQELTEMIKEGKIQKPYQITKVEKSPFRKTRVY